MARKLSILISDPNAYFTLGFRQGLSQHYAALGQPIFLTENILDKHRVDIVFLSAEHNTPQLRYLRHRGSGLQHQQMFIIKEKTSPFDSILFTDMDGILYRDQCLGRVIDLINKAIHAFSKHRFLPVHYDLPLTIREIEIIYGVSLGLPQAAIAKRHSLSTKTVSSHKRRAMEKLGITRTTDLHYWLLAGGLDFLTNTWKAQETINH
jgi:DNA-binding CsgD family transcriptional regulator